MSDNDGIPRCSGCGGTGRVPIPPDDPDYAFGDWRPCPACMGTGIGR